ncbi:MAG TPA: S8/S53 family peptidase [Streptosporangiaceae bacterium]|jgi:hypothetical protein
MSTPLSTPLQDTSRFREQLKVVKDVFSSPALGAHWDAPEPGPSLQNPRYAYQPGVLLVRGNAEAVLSAVEQAPAHMGTGEIRADLWHGPVGSADESADESGQVSLVSIGDRKVPEILSYLEEHATRDASGIGSNTVTPNHLFSICPGTLCPADEPFPADTGPIPGVSAGVAGHGVFVRVIDTGLVDNPEVGHPWMAGVEVSGDPRMPHIPAVTGGSRVGFDPKTQDIPEYYGHGTFIAGVLRCVAPGVRVHVHNHLRFAGAIYENQLLDALNEVLALEPDIISLSAGGTTRNGITPLGLDPFIQKLKAQDKTVLVAAAGNDGTNEKFWPAAYASTVPEVVSVGALREDGQGRACFSNYGDWVKIFAPGERLVNAFDQGTYRYVHSHSGLCRYFSPPLYQGCTCVAEHVKDDKVEFTGMARWSGTSFSTPYVAGLIAARMSQVRDQPPDMPTPGAAAESSQEAAKVLMNESLPNVDRSSYLPTIHHTPPLT